MKSKIIIFILMIIVTPCVALTQPIVNIPWCGSQDIFFWNASSDISGYRAINNYPELDSERAIYTSVSSATGSKTIGSFIIPSKSNNPIMLEPGLWRFRMYHNVSSSVGVTTFEYIVFNRSSTGVETNLFYGQALTSDVNSLTPVESLLSYARRNETNLFPGDRLVIKINASTTSVTPRDAWVTLAGNTRVSMVGVSWFVCDEDISYNETYQYSPTTATPFSTWLIFAIGGVVLFVMAFYRKMRNDNGGINKERIVLSLLGGVVNIFTAYLTLVVDIPNDSNHVLYEGGLMIVAFVIMGLICFAGAVYSLISPEIVENTENMGEKKK